MNQLNRRKWLTCTAGLMAAGASAGLATTQVRADSLSETGTKEAALTLSDFEPKSMLHVTETKVMRARFPVIDFHTHLSEVNQTKDGLKVENYATPDQVLAVMNRKNLRVMVNLTGGYGAHLDEAIRYWQTPHPDRFIVFTEPEYTRINERNYAQYQADEIESARKRGARGLKILKYLGLYLRENVTSGKLVKIDDARFDTMWEAAGANRMPVAIHISDPEAFFLPIDRYNERYEELSAHPDWSFHGKDYPSDRELQEARNRVIARHPRTQFVLLHMGNSENLEYVAEVMERFPNVTVEFGARIGELGRQPRTTRKFFDRYQDRVMFGTDATPKGFDVPQQLYGDKLYEIYYRFLETEDEYFDYAPAPKPPQGRWRIYGLGLSEIMLRKIYHDNAARLLNLQAI